MHANPRAQLRQLAALNKPFLYVVRSSLNTFNNTDKSLQCARLLQYRDKHARHHTARARQFVAAARKLNALAIINDNPRLAVLSKADGVHLGVNDTGIAVARAIVGPQRIIGVSCYASITLAHRAIAEGADYVAFGSVFPSPTKPRASRISLGCLKQYAAQLTVPVCAIGGINSGNIRSLVQSGVNLIAVSSASYGNRNLCRWLDV